MQNLRAKWKANGGKMEVKWRSKSVQNRRNDLPETSPRRLFTKTADLHETLLLIIQMHIWPPWELPFRSFGANSRPKTLPERYRKKRLETKTPQSHQKYSKMDPEMAAPFQRLRYFLVSEAPPGSQKVPRGAQSPQDLHLGFPNHQKIINIVII